MLVKVAARTDFLRLAALRSSPELGGSVVMQDESGTAVELHFDRGKMVSRVDAELGSLWEVVA